MEQFDGTSTASRGISRRGSIVVVLASLVFFAVFGPLGVSATAASSVAAGGSNLVLAQESATPVVEATPEGVTLCDALAPGVGTEAWIRAELYFGTTVPDGSMITDEDWQAFLDDEVTPRFPAGLTVLEGYGQFLNSAGAIAAEQSIVLISFYPADVVDESSDSLEEIRDAYETQFDQESVLRVDSAPVCVSF